MPKLLVRFTMIFAAIAGTPVVYTFLFAVIEDRLLRDDESALLLTNLIVGAILIQFWISVWKDVVPWTPQRKRRTAYSVVWSAAAASVLGLIMAAVLRNEEIAIFLAGLSWFVIWIVAVTLIWAETPVEHAQRFAQQTPRKIECLKCGYNMSGLHDARCPECGAQFTLDEMVASAEYHDPWA